MLMCPFSGRLHVITVETNHDLLMIQGWIRYVQKLGCSLLLFSFLFFVVSLLYSFIHLFFYSQLWRCPQLPFLLRSIFFPQVKYGRVQDDCNAAENNSNSFTPRSDRKKKREGGLCGGFKEPPCFQDLDWTGSAELAGYLARPTDPQKTQRRETCRSYLSIATLPLQRDRDKTRDQKKQTSVHFFMRYGTYTSTVNWEESRYAL